MQLKLFSAYKKSFQGLRVEVWYLSLVTLINRAGTMVIPFLSLYLTDDLDFTLKDVGWIMTGFGLGSVVGSWLGGKLTDKIGFYPVMFWSLILSGIMFASLQFMLSFWGLFFSVFVLMIVADVFRPAAYVAIATYSKPENKTRSITLLRLAINLGFSFGPAVGGLIIATIGYSGLFWVDGLTCIAAGFVFLITLTNKRQHKEQDLIETTIQSPYKDKHYLIFLLAVLLIGFAFLQLFSTIPLFYRDGHFLSEENIGYLMAANGVLIFIFEMPLVKYFEQDKFSIYKILIYSTLVFALSFAVLSFTNWSGILIVNLLLITFAEMLSFPFLNAFALKRAEGGSIGAYMGLFTMTFSLAHIFGHNAGMQLIDAFNFDVTWYFMTVILLIATLLLIWLKSLSKEIHIPK